MVFQANEKLGRHGIIMRIFFVYVLWDQQENPPSATWNMDLPHPV